MLDKDTFSWYSELKESMPKAKPYGKWLGEGTSMQDLMNDGEISEDTPDVETRGVRLRCFGYQQESLALILGPLAMNGEECMGTDTLLAALSDLPWSSFDFFFQLFAQVTSPPIDPIRESVVMSLGCWVGPEENLLGEPTPDHCRRLWLDHPCLTPRQFSSLSKTTKVKGWRSQTVDSTFPKREGSRGLEMNLSRICQEVIKAVDAGCQVIVFSGVAYLCFPREDFSFTRVGYQRANRSLHSAQLVSLRIAEFQQFSLGTANDLRNRQSTCCSGAILKLLKGMIQSLLLVNLLCKW